MNIWAWYKSVLSLCSSSFGQGILKDEINLICEFRHGTGAHCDEWPERQWVHAFTGFIHWTAIADMWKKRRSAKNAAALICCHNCFSRNVSKSIVGWESGRGQIDSRFSQQRLTRLIFPTNSTSLQYEKSVTKLSSAKTRSLPPLCLRLVTFDFLCVRSDPFQRLALRRWSGRKRNNLRTQSCRQGGSRLIRRLDIIGNEGIFRYKKANTI